MRCLFVYPNINGYHVDCYSFGLASIVSVARESGSELKVLVVRSKDDYSEFAREVSEFKPRLVGFSSVSSQFSFVKEMAGIVRSIDKEILNICGGVHPTLYPECVIETRDLDMVFVGESENSFREFLGALEYGKEPREVDNTAYVRKGELVVNRLKPLISDLDTLPYPDRDAYPMKDVLRETNYVPFLFSRGCPYNCTYCSNHAIAKRYGIKSNNPRYRSPESSIREIEEVRSKMDIPRVLIGDDIFGIDKEWRREFCELYKKRIGIKFMCLLRANIIDEEFVRLLKDSGCFRITIGVESGNDHIRNDVMRRNMSEETIVRAFEIVRKNGIETNAVNIIGVPGETEKMMRDTIALNRRIRPTTSGINIFYPYKGTALGDKCFEEGLVNEELYGSFSSERRDTVLNYPEEHKRKIRYFHKNWDKLVYGYDMKRFLKKRLRNTVLWKKYCDIRNKSGSDI
ncbi:MAG: radical SAM protein [Candidatus Omnitrophica bacterium]|nr:radical SAM protein [Candidatus Omnitrophota bacterium]